MTRHIIQKADEGPGGKLIAPAALRNSDPICQALSKRLPAQGRVLEIASGTGQHMAAFAAAFPDLTWTPSDVDAGQRDSIAAWRTDCNLANFCAPLAIDVAAPWPVDPGFAQAILTINLFHLIPEPFVPLFFAQALKALTKGGRVIVYGPFMRGSEFASEGDRDFDASLRARDPAIGYKRLEAINEVAMAQGFDPIAKDEMPANNLLLTFGRL